MSFVDDTSDCSDSSQSCDFSFGMDEFEEFKSDSDNEGVEVVVQKDIDDGFINDKCNGYHECDYWYHRYLFVEQLQHLRCLNLIQILQIRPFQTKNHMIDWSRSNLMYHHSQTHFK